MKAFCFALALLLSAPLFAQAGNEGNDESKILIDAPAEGEDMAGGAKTASGGVPFVAVLQALFVLVIVAFALYGCIYFLKKTRVKEAEKNAFLKVLAVTPINTRAGAAVISLGEKAWLLGLSDSSVSLIAEITDRETVDAMTLEYESAVVNAPAAGSFLKILRRFIPPDKAAQSATSGAAGGENFSNLQKNLMETRNRLKNL